MRADAPTPCSRRGSVTRRPARAGPGAPRAGRDPVHRCLDRVRGGCAAPRAESGRGAGELARRNEAHDLHPRRRRRRASRARSRTRLQAASSPVASRSTRFIDTWTRPRLASGKPSARTPGSPPSRSRTAAGQPAGQVEVVGVELAVHRDHRRAGAHRGRAEPRVRARAARRSGAARRERVAPGLGQGAAGRDRRRRRGTPGRRAVDANQLGERAAPPATADSASPSSATNGTTSRMPEAGCTPSEPRRSKGPAATASASRRTAASVSAAVPARRA